MDAPPSLVRLAVGGLLLDPRAFRAQRDAPGGMRRGFLLVLLIGLLVGFAALIGDLGEYFTQPEPAQVNATIYRGLTAMPWYAPAVQANPGIGTLVEQTFGPQGGGLSLTPSPVSAALALLITPVVSVVSWLLSGAFVHIAARALGGAASFGQTMATVALASAPGLLGLVQVVPYAQALPLALTIASGLLGLIATYVAVRESHGLPPWRAFWSVLIGPLLLSVLLGGLYCCFVFVFAGAIGGLT
jgi:hypothetical protein